MADEKEMTAATETPVQEAAAEPAETAAEIVENPAQSEEVPAQSEEVPAQPEEVPAQPEEAPAQPEEVPVQPEEVPTETEEVPTETEEAPAQPEEIPAETAGQPAEDKETSSVEKRQDEKPAEAEKTDTKAEAPAQEANTAKDTVLTALGIILCLILAPILIANITMIVRSYTDSDTVPSFGGYCPFIVMTDSMKGTIDGGDLVFDKVVTDPTQIRKGDIISFFDPASSSSSIVTHRVVEVVSDSDVLSFRTKGDANNDVDDDLVPAEKVVGLYKTKISGLGNVVMFMQSTPGLVVCIALPIFLLIGYDYIRRSRFEKKQKSETAALMEELQALREKQGKE